MSKTWEKGWYRVTDCDFNVSVARMRVEGPNLGFDSKIRDGYQIEKVLLVTESELYELVRKALQIAQREAEEFEI